MTPERRFAFRLALALGYANPEYMLASMPWRIWQDWIAYNALEPIGEERADLRAGIIAATTANCLARRKGKPAYRAADFMPKFGEQRRWLTPDEQFKKILIANRLLGGRVVKVDGPIVAGRLRGRDD